MLITASHADFILKAIRGEIDGSLQRIILSVHIYIDNAEMRRVRKELSGQTEKSLFELMWKNQRLKGVDAEKHRCRIIGGSFINLDERNFFVAVASDFKLIYWSNLHDQDRDILAQNHVSCFENESDVWNWVLHGLTRDRLVKMFVLKRGESKKASDIIIEYFLHASTIKIYDRYFNSDALATLKELLEGLANRIDPKPDLNIKIYWEDSQLDKGEIERSLKPYLGRNSKLTWLQISRGSSIGKPHDRFIQVDNRYGLCLTKGLDAFMGGRRNLNEDSFIFVFTIAADALPVQFEVGAGAGPKKIEQIYI